MTDPVIRQKWIAMLAKLCAPMDPALAAAALVAMLPMLADFPDAAFCQRSLAHVAGRAKRTPSFAELRGWIAEWWRDNRPAPSNAIGDDHLSPADLRWLDYWQRRQAEGFTPLRGRDGELLQPEVQDWKRHTAELLRVNAPKTFERIAEVVA